MDLWWSLRAYTLDAFIRLLLLPKDRPMPCMGVGKNASHVLWLDAGGPLLIHTSLFLYLQHIRPWRGCFKGALCWFVQLIIKRDFFLALKLQTQQIEIRHSVALIWKEHSLLFKSLHLCKRHPMRRKSAQRVHKSLVYGKKRLFEIVNHAKLL